MTHNHPRLFERLEGYWGARFVIDPVDLPIVFLLCPDPTAPRLTAAWSREGQNPTAVIGGRMLRLIDLLEGELDGDALFFSRDIEIEGDTGAVLALRNAIESEEIVLFREFAEALGPFGAPVRLIGERGPDAVAAARGVLNRLTALLLGANHRPEETT
ncbi:MAG: SCP2 sterol-binding domain-containing protein [Hyphomicrobiales bacterium]|nr:SCP2 sterol-binding domain-containing protein [Hyphomicrobiales bacterium]